MIRQKQNFLSANWIAPADNTQFSDPFGSIFISGKESLVNKPGSCGKKMAAMSRKELRRNYSRIGHNNTTHFLCPIRSQHLLDCLEMIRWESVPRGFFTWAWKLFSRLFSLPDWLPLGLQGWVKAVCPYLWLVTGQVIYSYPYREIVYLKVSDILPLLPQLK